MHESLGRINLARDMHEKWFAMRIADAWQCIVYFLLRPREMHISDLLKDEIVLKAVNHCCFCCRQFACGHEM